MKGGTGFRWLSAGSNEKFVGDAMDVSVFIYLFSSLLNDAFVTRYSVE
jgi:hypothetical protein